MVDIDVTKKPLPTPNAVSAPYWSGLADGQVRLQRCSVCSRVQFYPRPACRYCGSRSLHWEDLSGRATLYSYTVVYRAPFEAFADDVPYVLAVVELEEGPRLLTTLEDVSEEDIQIGMSLDPIFDRINDDVTLLRFRPAS